MVWRLRKAAEPASMQARLAVTHQVCGRETNQPSFACVTSGTHHMKLYYSPGACSLSPHIALHEAGIAFEPVLASTKSHKLQDGTDYYGINPLGYVPMLELDDGTRLREGPAIVQYIADLAPAKNLAPANGTMP